MNQEMRNYERKNSNQFAHSGRGQNERMNFPKEHE